MKKLLDLYGADCVIDEKYIWFVPMELPMLMKADISTGEILDKVNLPVDYYASVGYYERLIKAGDLIIGIPFWAGQYFIYSLSEGTIQVFDTPGDLRGTAGVYFDETVMYGSSLLSFPRFCEGNWDSASQIMKFDLKEKTVARGSIPVGVITDRLFNTVIRRCSVECKGKIYLLHGFRNEIIEFDGRTEEARNYQICESSMRPTTITLIDEENRDFLITDNDGRIILWNLKTGNEKIIPIEIEGFRELDKTGFEGWHELFSFSMKCGEDVYLFPGFSNRIVKYSIADHKMESVFEDAVCAFQEEEYRSMANCSGMCGQFSRPYLHGDVICVWNKRIFAICRVFNFSR